MKVEVETPECPVDGVPKESEGGRRRKRIP